jgi:hypothetical protein
MTTPAGTIALSNVNAELARAASAAINMDNAGVRTLAGVPSGTIAMSNLRNRSNTGTTTWPWVVSMAGAVRTLGYWSGPASSSFVAGQLSFAPPAQTLSPNKNGIWTITSVTLYYDTADYYPETTVVMVFGGTVLPPANLVTTLRLTDGLGRSTYWSTPYQSYVGMNSGVGYHMSYWGAGVAGTPLLSQSQVFFQGNPTYGTVTLNA